jgi:uncharacterized protein (TIGR01244 family)
MQERMKLNEETTVGAQPTEEQLRELREQGFRSVVNLRTEGEENQPLAPAAEGAKAREAGLEYLHLPVSMQRMQPELVDRFREELPRLPKPVYIHCGAGKRAGVFAMIDLALQAGWSGEETLRRAEAMGFECDQPELKEFVKRYIDRRRGQAQAA